MHWRGPAAIANDRPMTMTAGFHLGKKILALSLKGLGAKTN
jgi:hypothetical protein